MRRALEREDLFLAGIEVALTDSMKYCDVVLPACTHFEHHDLFAAYGQHWLQRAEPVIPPQDEALPNTAIFRRLAARFGYTERCFTATDAELMDDAVDAADPRLGGVRPSELPLDRAMPMTVQGQDAMMFVNVFPKTPSGKVELASGYLDKRFGARLPSYRTLSSSYPLTLISPASDQRITSTFGGTRTSEDVPPLEMHPDDAKARGLVDGQPVRVWNELGEVRLPLRITTDVPRGVVSSLKGAWLRSSDNMQTVSALAPATHADICEGACYNDARVDVAAARA
jgi:anaerobic selenocysteine-containing dehydrogenase